MQFFTLDKILLLLSESNYSISNLFRIEKKLDLKNQNELKNYVIPQELFDAILSDPESSTFHYVFKAIPKSKIDVFTRSWVTQFSRNIVTETLRDKITRLKDIQNENDSLIDYLRQAIKDKDSYIQNMEQAIKDKDSYIQNMEQAIKEKDNQLDKIHQSFTWKMLRKWDRSIGKRTKNKD